MRIRSRSLLVAFAATISLCATSCRTAGREPVPQRLDAFFTDLHARGLFDGAVVVSDRSGVVWEKGYGFANAQHEVPFTPATVTDGASLAKTFTAALVLMLQSEGVLRLDDAVQRSIPELLYPEITIRQLLSHTSGLPVRDYDFFDPYLAQGTVRRTETLVGVLQAQRPALVAKPGTTFEYSSFGYDVAALTAARAAGKTYVRLLDEKIFKPLGITSAFVRPGRLADFPGVRTLGYRRVDGKLQVHDVFDGEAFAGGSNIYISARDLDRWNRFFLTSPDLIAGASTPARVGGAQAALTLGNWYHANDATAFWYSGHLQGFHDEVFRDRRSGISIVYVSNNTIGPWLQKGIVRDVRSILGGTARVFAEPAVSAIGKEERSKLAGTWAAGREPVEIAHRDGDLFVVHRGVSYRMVHVDPAAFYTPGLDWMIGFQRNASGAIDRIYVEDNLQVRRGSRARH